MFTKEIILLCYVACITMLVAGGTCCGLVVKRKKNANKAHLLFIIGLLLMCIYDMGIYYWNYVTDRFSSLEVLRIGSCVIAVTMFLWIMVMETIVNRQALKHFNAMVKNYLILYIAVWLLFTVVVNGSFFYTIKWLLLSTDILLVIAFLGVTVAHIVYASVQGDKGNLYHLSVVTALLLWNYCSYFWGETSVYWGNSEFVREPLDLTVVFWLIISVFVLIYSYKREFVPVFFKNDYEEDDTDRHESHDAKSTLSERISEVCEKYGLTNREREFVDLIYAGKSNKEISELLFISESTVKTHIYNIFRKMDVKNRVSVICLINDEIEER